MPLRTGTASAKAMPSGTAVAQHTQSDGRLWSWDGRIRDARTRAEMITGNQTSRADRNPNQHETAIRHTKSTDFFRAAPSENHAEHTSSNTAQSVRLRNSRARSSEIMAKGTLSVAY